MTNKAGLDKILEELAVLGAPYNERDNRLMEKRHIAIRAHIEAQDAVIAELVEAYDKNLSGNQYTGMTAVIKRAKAAVEKAEGEK